MSMHSETRQQDKDTHRKECVVEVVAERLSRGARRVAGNGRWVSALTVVRCPRRGRHYPKYIIRKTLSTHARTLCYAAEDTIDSCSYSTAGTKHHVHPRVSLTLSAHLSEISHGLLDKLP